MQFGKLFTATFLLTFLTTFLAFGQSSTATIIPNRVVQSIDDAQVTPLPGNVPPGARAEFDRGMVASSTPMEHMLLVLQRSPEQETALAAFMEAQMDPASADFHHWLEPEEFGRLYGLSDYDMQAVTSWLSNHGFRIDEISKGKLFIAFSGDAAQVQSAFHTEIHRYIANGEEHISNNADPSIPEALSPVVAGIASLHNFFAAPLHRDLGAFHLDAETGKWIPEKAGVGTKPLFGVAENGGTFELVSPYDFAAIYNVLPSWNAKIDGSGQTIAIAGRSDINLADVAAFRSAFGLPAKAPTVIVNGKDPGVPSADDKVENTLDVEWSGAVAKGATVKFVTTASTNTSDGAEASAVYIIDHKVATVMSYSYGLCELKFGTAGNAAYSKLWQQGAAEGISIFVASGDQGSAACDGGGSPPYDASEGLQVSGAASTPYNVAVGGTDLNWATSSKTYWAKTNAANHSSALGYIPEVPWNGTCVSDAVDLLIGGSAAGYDEEETCQALLTDGIDSFLISVTGGSGGKSACTTPKSTTPASCAGGYAKPSWQTGTGVPGDGKRDLPDVSLFASSGALNTAYVICDSAIGPCNFSNANDSLAQGVGGTSVASPAMAGVMALVNQKLGAPQGNANAGFYALAARDTRSKCNAVSVGAGNSCNFYDVTTDNNAVPCAPGTQNCVHHHAADQVGVMSGYTSTAGYDLATGLGSTNVSNLVNNWHLILPAPAVKLSATALTFATTKVGKTSPTQVLTVSNTGKGTLAISSISLGGTAASAFVITAKSCGSTLSAGQKCTVTLAFKPAKTGTLSADLAITDNAAGSPQKVALTGKGD